MIPAWRWQIGKGDGGGRGGGGKVVAEGTVEGVGVEGKKEGRE